VLQIKGCRSRDQGLEQNTAYAATESDFKIFQEFAPWQDQLRAEALTA